MACFWYVDDKLGWNPASCLTPIKIDLFQLQSVHQFWPTFLCITQTCQSLVKENLETHGKKKSGDSTVNIEILFFSPWSNPFSNLGDALKLDTNFIPRASTPLSKWQTDPEKQSYWTQAKKITARNEKVISTVTSFFISLSLLIATSINPRKYSIFIELISFQKDISQKPVRLGPLPWDREKWQNNMRPIAWEQPHIWKYTLERHRANSKVKWSFRECQKVRIASLFCLHMCSQMWAFTQAEPWELAGLHHVSKHILSMGNDRKDGPTKYQGKNTACHQSAIPSPLLFLSTSRFPLDLIVQYCWVPSNVCVTHQEVAKTFQ